MNVIAFYWDCNTWDCLAAVFYCLDTKIYPITLPNLIHAMSFYQRHCYLHCYWYYVLLPAPKESLCPEGILLEGGEGARRADEGSLQYVILNPTSHPERSRRICGLYLTPHSLRLA